ncbi:MAG: hypothetical protein CMJ78_26775 [Planctomycetaceae bacterium]|nr:hypothetical protein [Planctomycetaceae bacterium]
MKENGPQHISGALSKVIALRGLARKKSVSQFEDAWREIAGDVIASQTRVVVLRNRVLHIDVNNAALLGELSGFHKPSLLKRLKEIAGAKVIQDIKFRLNGNVGKKASQPSDDGLQ